MDDLDLKFVPLEPIAPFEDDFFADLVANFDIPTDIDSNDSLNTTAPVQLKTDRDGSMKKINTMDFNPVRSEPQKQIQQEQQLKRIIHANQQIHHEKQCNYVKQQQQANGLKELIDIPQDKWYFDIVSCDKQRNNFSGREQTGTDKHKLINKSDEDLQWAGVENMKFEDVQESINSVIEYSKQLETFRQDVFKRKLTTPLNADADIVKGPAPKAATHPTSIGTISQYHSRYKNKNPVYPRAVSNNINNSSNTTKFNYSNNQIPSATTFTMMRKENTISNTFTASSSTSKPQPGDGAKSNVAKNQKCISCGKVERSLRQNKCDQCHFNQFPPKPTISGVISNSNNTIPKSVPVYQPSQAEIDEFTERKKYKASLDKDGNPITCVICYRTHVIIAARRMCNSCYRKQRRAEGGKKVEY